MIFFSALIAAVYVLSASAVEAPLAPALANSNWPIAHASTWNSDYTANKGPTSGKSNVELFVNGDNFSDLLDILASADPITLVQSNVTGYTWGSSISSVFQTKTDENGFQLINTYFRDYNFEYHGAYCLLAHDGTYFAATRNSIVAYNNKIPFDFTTPIVKNGEYFIPGLFEDEHIVGLTITHDSPAENAFLIFATSQGHVGGVSLNFQKSTNLFLIPGGNQVSMPSHFVSNSIGMDGIEGGIYVCTSRSMTRLTWQPAAQQIELAWDTVYGTGQDEWYWGRLGPGCGTSPTIVGPHNTKPEYVVITDGENPMNIRFFDVHTGKQAGSHIVTFGQDLPCNSTTDQSIVVKGYEAVVVNNWVADSVTPLCSEFIANMNVTEAIKHECPFIFGAFVNGIEKFAINPVTKEVTSKWANTEVSCSSSIPVVTEENTLYCLGKREHMISDTRRSFYAMEAVNWNTGHSLFYVPLGSSLLYNALYAATEVGTNNDIVMGTLAGIVRVSPQSTNSNTTTTTTTTNVKKCLPNTFNEDVCIMEALNLQDHTPLTSKQLEFWEKLDALVEVYNSKAF
jgi:hypothetical protein